jgi:hypothetical protein
MRMRIAAIACLVLAAPALADPPAPALAPGTYTNEEDVGFSGEQGRTPPPWTGLLVDDAGVERFVDPFGQPVAAAALRARTISADGSIRATRADGITTTLRRARPATCWIAIPRDAKKADGSTDWYFVRDARLHDQGGRVQAGGVAHGAAALVLRMRNVVWAQGPNRPSLVLYVHRPEEPDRALSYAWADPGAKRIGINLRWMQASCTLEEAEGGKTP